MRNLGGAIPDSTAIGGRPRASAACLLKSDDSGDLHANGGLVTSRVLST
jgi:hypothetical protein